MTLHTHAARRLLTGATVLGAGLGLAACGSFDSAASGNQLIRNYVKQYGSPGGVTVRAVKCPSGVKQQTGTSYNCSVTLHVRSTGANSSGTITIHMVSGNKVEIRGRQDVHIP